eukprot:scaffold544_cov320-Pavlova_lutheri.AAC.33
MKRIASTCASNPCFCPSTLDRSPVHLPNREKDPPSPSPPDDARPPSPGGPLGHGPCPVHSRSFEDRSKDRFELGPFAVFSRSMDGVVPRNTHVRDVHFDPIRRVVASICRRFFSARPRSDPLEAVPRIHSGRKGTWRPRSGPAGARGSVRHRGLVRFGDPHVLVLPTWPRVLRAPRRSMDAAGTVPRPSKDA